MRVVSMAAYPASVVKVSGGTTSAMRLASSPKAEYSFMPQRDFGVVVSCSHIPSCFNQLLKPEGAPDQGGTEARLSPLKASTNFLNQSSVELD